MTATDPYIGIAACRVLRHRGLVPQRDLVLRMIELFVQQDAGRDLKDYRNKDIRADILFLAECAAAAGAADEARRLLENAHWEIGEAPFFDIADNVSAGLRKRALDWFLQRLDPPPTD